MSSHVHDAREGGSFRISLTCDAHAGTGKTTAYTDTYHGRFVKLVTNKQVVEVVEFETTNPALRGEMTITTTLVDSDGLSERDLEHRDDDFVLLVVVDAGQAVMVSAVRGQHKFFGQVGVLNSGDTHQFARRTIKGADGAEAGGPRIEARAWRAIGSASDPKVGPMCLVRDDLKGAGDDLVL